MRIYHFYRKLIQDNPMKSVLFFYMCLSLYQAITIEPYYKSEKNLQNIYNVNTDLIEVEAGDHNIITYTISNNKLIVKQKIIEKSFKHWMLLFYILGPISLIALLLAPIVEEDWGIHNCRVYSYLRLVEVELESNQYVYYIQGRILTKSSNLLHQYDVENLLKNYIESPKIYLIGSPIRKTRENLLNKILKK